MALKKWLDICQPKLCGGFEFRLFNDYNTTLLSKLTKKIATRDQNF